MTTRNFAFHPHLKDGSTTNSALVHAAEKTDIEVRDMYQLYPNFDIDVKTEQAILEDTDRIVLQFPMYWYSSPALMKEWLDRVLEYGWAYGSTGNALQGKEVILAVTQCAKAEDYTSEGRFHVTAEDLLKPFVTIQYHTGLKFLEPFVLPDMMAPSKDQLEKSSQAYVDYIQK